jgi:Spy/CpxP family protein refolding chaperone
MKQTVLKFALVLSLLLNAGVIGAVAYSAYQDGQWPSMPGAKSETSLPDYLGLNAEQRRRWHELEAEFLDALKKDWGGIRNHREAMIREIFSERPDRARIESERAAVTELQSAQQQRIIEQLLRERDLLDAEQRGKLADLLLRQAPASTFEEQLHGK